VYKLAKALGFGAGSTILYLIAMFIPLLNLICLLDLNSKATSILRDAGIKVGLMGAKLSDLPDVVGGKRTKMTAQTPTRATIGEIRPIKFPNWTDTEIRRWLWLRAVEWNAFPSYSSQPLVPIMFIFFPWYLVIATVLALNILWTAMRYSYVNVAISKNAAYFVYFAKWPLTIGSAIYLFLHHELIPALIALAWPWLAGFVGIPGKIGVIELALAKKIGFVPEDTVL
jgi:hypothetical protein